MPNGTDLPQKGGLPSDTQQGGWNAATNTPTLTSGVGSDGEYYLVSVAGATVIDGISTWNVDDVIIYIEGAWRRFPGNNSVAGAVASVFGRVGAVVSVAGDYDASQIDNDSTVAGAFVSDALNNLIPSAEKGAANGVATLDGTGRIPSAQLPTSSMEYKGAWNANTNTPALASGVGTNGDYYRVSVAGNTNLDGITDWEVGDNAIFNGTLGVWEKIDNSDLVSSVFGRIGTVTAQASDYDASQIDNDSTVAGAFVSDALNNLIPSAEKGAANGVATLDGTGRIPSAQLPTSSMEYKGAWNANTNTPALASGVGTNGDYYRVSVAGNTNLDGITDWEVGDNAIFNGTLGVWEKIDNSDIVSSVFGRIGTVTAAASDYDASQIDNDSTIPGAFVSDALNNLIPSSEKGAAFGVATLDGGSTIPPGQIPDQTYTESVTAIAGSAAGAWVTRTIAGSAGKTIEVLVGRAGGGGGAQTAGVRAFGSALARTWMNAPQRATSVLVQLDSLGQFEIFSTSALSTFTKIGELD